MKTFRLVLSPTSKLSILAEAWAEIDTDEEKAVGQFPIIRLLSTWGGKHVANVKNGHFFGHPLERALRVV